MILPISDSRSRRDKFNVKVLRLLHKKHPKLLCRLLSACLVHRHFPSPWKIGRVVFIHKHGKDPASPDGYRPILLLSTLGKLYEKLIAAQLTTYLTSTNFLSDHQFGFRTGISTETAAQKADSTIREFSNSHYLTAVIALDIQGAFDHARWLIVLHTLQKEGLPHYLLGTIRSAWQHVKGRLFSSPEDAPKGPFWGHSSGT